MLLAHAVHERTAKRRYSKVNLKDKTTLPELWGACPAACAGHRAIRSSCPPSAIAIAGSAMCGHHLYELWTHH